MKSLDKKLVRDLWRLRGQVIAIALVIGGGVATLVMALSTLHSLQDTRDAYYERYRFADVFAHAKRAPQWLLSEIAAIPGVGWVDGRIVQNVIVNVKSMPQPVRGRVLSRETRREGHLNEIVIRRGRDLRPGHPDEILVHEAFAEAHGLLPGDTIQAIVNERLRTLRVVGIALTPEYVYAIGPGTIVPDNRRFGVLWMSREALEAAYDLKGAFNDVSLRLERNADEDLVIDRLDALLKPYGGTGAYGREDQLSAAFLSSEIENLGNLAAVVPPIFMAVAAFLLNIVIVRVIQTEREQIGLLKAFGYSNFEVGWFYLKFVMVITALGVAFGWASGAWMGDGVTHMYQDYFRFPFLAYQADLPSFAMGALVGFGVAGIGTLTGVRRAVKLAPATAMQPQAPTSYRVNFWERLGPMRFYTQAARMMVRHIFRWPLRAAMTVIGLGFSVAILVASLFFIDAMDAEIESYFFNTQRQDMSLVFNELRADDVRENLKALPGVLAVETVRDVPVRLSFGPRRERVAIQGLKPDADLNRLVDARGRTVELPPEGLVLSDKLAELLGATEGDIVHVSALEGRRAEVDVPVAQVVRQYIGVAAYMDRRALNRIMREGTAVSGANLMVDASAEPKLYAALKKTPVLQGLAERAADYGMFRDMIEEHLYTMLAFYILFASLIAVGVVYNSARIALSERARELASLRVLGFTKREVGIILVGELAILTFFALPLGCVIGYWLAALMSSLFDTKLYRIPLIIDPSTYGIGVVVALIATIVSAAIVVRRVANLDLIAVLKTRE